VQAGDIVIDEIGIGSGIVDRLRELGFSVKGFVGGSSPRGGSRRAARFLNRRAQTFWELRQKLEAGEIALPEDEQLADELCAIQWKITSAGKIQIEPKDELRGRLGRSPDRADAVAMAFGG